MSLLVYTVSSLCNIIALSRDVPAPISIITNSCTSICLTPSFGLSPSPESLGGFAKWIALMRSSASDLFFESWGRRRCRQFSDARN
ncbi:hypothetical protein F5141DRAFT_1129291 [Pisolithus sp. B1]|nr:hypothetical protein F5141DRAFT_1129291 [Pisolithus sp. B1]